MPGTLTLTGFNNVTVRTVTPTVATTSVSGISQRKQIAGQFWEFDVEYSHLSRKQFNQVMGFLSKQRNSLYSFTVTMPVLSDTSGSVATVAADNSGLSTTMTITGNAGTGSSSVNFDTAYNSSYFTSSGVDATEGLVAGDFIKFSNHDKVYQITDDVTFNASGGGTINFFPNLTDAVTTSDTIVYTQVPFTVFNKRDTQEFQFGIGGENAITIQLQEAL
jgi:hypothetical protein